MDEYDIYIEHVAGDPGADPAARVARAFGLPEPRAREFVASLPRVVKRAVGGAEAERYAQLLREIGAAFELRQRPIKPAQVIAVAGPPAEREPEPAARRVTADQPGSGATWVLPDLFAATAAPARPPSQQTLREGSLVPRSQQTLREASPAAFEPRAPFAAPPAPQPAPQPALRSAPLPVAYDWPAPAQRAAPAPPAVVSVASVGAPSAWGALDPAGGEERAGVAAAIGPSVQPAWLASGADKFDVDLVVPPMEFMDRGPDAPARRAPPEPAARAARASEQPDAVGVALGRELPSEPPFALRAAIRVGLGISLFLIVTIARHWHPFGSDLERELERFGAEGGGAEGAATAAPAERGPIASDWLEPPLHHVTSGDKDQVRDLVQRLKRAGATEVYVGAIMRSGPVQIAGELIVELPANPARRKAVLAARTGPVEGAGGALDGEPEDPGGPLLRIAL